MSPIPTSSTTAAPLAAFIYARPAPSMKAPRISPTSPPHNATIDTGNLAANVVPARADLRFNDRFNHRWTPETLAGEIEGASGRRPAKSASSSPSSRPIRGILPRRARRLRRHDHKRHRRRDEGLHAQAVHERGTSDARFIKTYCPVVEFGLVGDTMHGVDERAAIADHQILTAIYGRVIDAYFATWGQVGPSVATA